LVMYNATFSRRWAFDGLLSSMYTLQALTRSRKLRITTGVSTESKQQTRTCHYSIQGGCEQIVSKLSQSTSVQFTLLNVYCSLVWVSHCLWIMHVRSRQYLHNFVSIYMDLPASTQIWGSLHGPEDLVSIYTDLSM
jgi:hypothetical protein